MSVFEGNFSDLDDDLMLIRSRHDHNRYEHAVMVVFWFAIHIENLEVARFLLIKEDLIK